MSLFRTFLTLSLVGLFVACGSDKTDESDQPAETTTQAALDAKPAESESDSMPATDTAEDMATEENAADTAAETSPDAELDIVLKETFEGFETPESVLRVADSLYVSQLGAELKPSEMDGDGSIAELDMQGEVISRKLFPTAGILHAPKGMASLDNTLYVADINRVVGYALETREQVFELDLSTTGMTFANDLAQLDPDSLILTVTDLNKIYRIDVKAEGGEFLEIPTTGELVGPNGVAVVENERPQGNFVSRRVYIGGYGAEGNPGMLSSISFTMDIDDPSATFGDGSGPEVMPLTDLTGSFDGLAVLNETHLLVTDWQGEGDNGEFHVVNVESRDVQTFPIPAPSTADFYWDAETQSIWLPTMMTNQVHRFEITGL